MKRLMAIVLATLLICPVFATEERDIDISAYINNEVFVMYRDGSFEVLAFDNPDALKAGLAQLYENEDAEVIQPNYTYTQTSLTNDEYADRQWALSNDGSFFMEEKKNEHPVFDTPFGDAKRPWEWHEPDFFGRPGGFRPFASANTSGNVTAKADIDVNAEEAWKIYSPGEKEVVVAIVDTGVDYTHEELSGRIWTNTDEIAGNGIDDDNNGYIDDVYGWNFYNNNNKVYVGSEDDHGTHGAGTIVAKSGNGKGIAGIAQSDNIKVMSIKALGGRNGSGSTASIIRAIRYAEANGADICNLSLGTSVSDVALYQTMAKSDMLFVSASGNDGVNTDSRPSYPASYNLDNIISVANLNYDGNLHYSSNYGESSVDIAAPGSYILSTTTNGTYSYMSGTSMSAPMVSAAAALVYSHHGDSVSLLDVKKILLTSAAKLDSLTGTSTTGGMLDIAAALSLDVTTLPEEETETKDKGSAPILKAYMVQKGGEQYLTVSVNDAEGDVTLVKYAEGEKDKAYFKNSGTLLAISDDGTATITPKAGTFTFYALDSAGNETAIAVTVTEREETPRREYDRKRGERRFPLSHDPFADMEMPDFFKEIVNEFFPEIAPWILGW